MKNKLEQIKGLLANAQQMLKELEQEKECEHCMCYAGYIGENNQFSCCRCGKKATICMTAECPKGFFKHDVETEGCINFKLNK